MIDLVKANLALTAFLSVLFLITVALQVASLVS